MKTLKPILAAFVNLILLSTINTVHAQNSATVQATASVLDPVTITSSTGIDFGEGILPGLSQSISSTDANAAKFALTAVGGNYVSVTFDLPDVLLHNLGEDEMPIIFGPNDASKSEDDDVTSSQAFDPHFESTHIVAGSGSDLFIWLGATINPKSDQTAGTYSGDITIELAYTEN